MELISKSGPGRIETVSVDTCVCHCSYQTCSEKIFAAVRDMTALFPQVSGYSLAKVNIQ